VSEDTTSVMAGEPVMSPGPFIKIEARGL